MNGKYVVASGSKQGVPFNDDYASKGHEYFDVWAPEIATHYGEVFWTDQGVLSLPDDIIKRFAGKVIAITGYEQDQVMVQPTGQPGVNPKLDVSVPINWAYNHHYMTWMTGNYSEMRQIIIDKNDVSAHGSPRKWIAVERESAAFRADPSIPTSQLYSEGNGGESRKSFHGYPKGFAQLIESPTSWHITPMQIDTRNRDCGVTIADIKNCTKFTPGPEPKQARYGYGIPKAGTNYSGILECPCNGRYGGDPSIYGKDTKTKVTAHKYAAQVAFPCSAAETVGNAQECFDAASTLGIAATKIVNVTAQDSSLPQGCSYTVFTNGTAVIYANSAPSKVKCAMKSGHTNGEAASVIGVKLSIALDAKQGQVKFLRSKKGQYCASNHLNVLEKFVMKEAGAAEAERALSQCEKYCSDSDACWGCSVDCSLGSMDVCQWVAIPDCGTVNSWAGLIEGDISNKQSGVAKITLSGPSDRWFGVGLNAQLMSDHPYTFIVNSTGVYEQKLGTCGSEASHCPGTWLSKSITLESNSVVSGKRVVVFTRAMQGQTHDHYTFNPASQSTLPFITAIGSSQVFAYHQAHMPATLSFAQTGNPACVCDQGASGKLCETDGTGCDSFVKQCVARPDGDLLFQRNPTCNSRQYAGGLRCCHHGRIMLDADQPVRKELLRYHMKFRFWFQEYTPASGGKPASHQNLPRIYQQTEANAGEYDIPPAFARPGLPIPGYPGWPENKPTPGTSCTGNCPDGDDCECAHEINYMWNTGSSPMRLIYAGGHCHAPSCIKMELYRNDTGELLCRQVPILGKGRVEVDKYDEAGYIAIPPCLWGDDEGLEPSVLMPPNTPLLMKKWNRNTLEGHFGEMASWQMRGVAS